jgi:hypothetical protein
MPARLNPVPGKKFHAIQPAFIRFAGIRVFASLLHSVGKLQKQIASAVCWRWQRKNKQEDSIN